jgi:glycosyltransferase involved in cell wall biosynthesis
MNVGFDARKYFDFGIGTYIRNLASFFDRQEQDRFTYFARPEDAGLIRGTHRGSTIVNRSGKYSVAELVTLSFQANRAGISLFHAPHYTLPFGLSMRRVVTIHDVIHLRFPAYFSPVQRAYAKMMIGHACRAADAVIVDSEFAGKELLRRIPCPPEKIHVIPLGVSGDFVPAKDNTSADEFRRKHNVGKRFLLYVGSLKPHKNVAALIRSLSSLNDLTDVQIVCAGERLEEDVALHALCMSTGVGDRVRSLGWLPEPDLIAAYRAATAVVMPSLYEGFGFPVLEAMACGTPVIGSNAASIPEVMGDAGILVDPSVQGDLANAIRSVLDDSSLRDSLREKGLRRAKLFTWQRCAEMTLNLYRSLV